jgi:hypothetical protein
VSDKETKIDNPQATEKEKSEIVVQILFSRKRGEK